MAELALSLTEETVQEAILFRGSVTPSFPFTLPQLFYPSPAFSSSSFPSEAPLPSFPSLSLPKSSPFNPARVSRNVVLAARATVAYLEPKKGTSGGKDLRFLMPYYDQNWSFKQYVGWHSKMSPDTPSPPHTLNSPVLFAPKNSQFLQSASKGKQAATKFRISALFSLLAVKCCE